MRFTKKFLPTKIYILCLVMVCFLAFNSNMVNAGDKFNIFNTIYGPYITNNIEISYQGTIDVGWNSAPTLIDLDNDGDLDLVLGEGSGNLIYYQNTGTVTTPTWTEDMLMFSGIDVGNYSAPTFADLDNDGDMDLTIGESTGTLKYYENTGTVTAPIWTEDILMFSEIDVGSYSAPTFADLDNDGDLDLTSGESNGLLKYYENTGTVTAPIWTEDILMFSGIIAGYYSKPVFADLDSDGDLDLTSGESAGILKYYENTGTATAPIWAEDTLMFTGITAGYSSTPTLADLDNDGDLDLTSGESNGLLKYYENTGTAIAPVWAENTLIFSGVTIGYCSKSAFADLNNDGDLDLSIGEYYGTLKYYENTGTVTAPIWTEDVLMFSGIDVGDYSVPTFADLDNDGDLDLTIGEAAGTLKYYENTGTVASPIWTEDVLMFSGIDAGADSVPAFADLDNDGDLDLTIGEFYTGTLKYYENTGTSAVPIWTEDILMFSGITVGQGSAPAFTDLDNDGDIDLIVGEYYGSLKYYQNTGTVTTPIWTGDSSVFSGMGVGYFSAPAFADLDNDGDLELITGDMYVPLTYYDMITVTDTTPPTITISNIPVITNQDVTPVITVTDDQDPSPVVVTTLNDLPYDGSTITTEGEYLLRVIATDASDNTATAEVNFTIDKTSPEAVIHWSPDNLNIVVYGTDNFDTNVEITAVGNQYTLVDDAGNSLIINLSIAIKPNTIEAVVQNLQYNNDPIITPPDNVYSNDYKILGGILSKLVQVVEVLSSFSIQTDYKKGVTEITINGQSFTFDGLVIVDMITNAGELGSKYSD